MDQGINGEEGLGKAIRGREQYHAGRKAGEVLKRIHSIEKRKCK